MRVGTSPGVTGDMWHDLMVWDVVVRTRGQKAAHVGRGCQDVDRDSGVF